MKSVIALVKKFTPEELNMVLRNIKLGFTELEERLSRLEGGGNATLPIGDYELVIRHGTLMVKHKDEDYAAVPGSRVYCFAGRQSDDDEPSFYVQPTPAWVYPSFIDVNNGGNEAYGSGWQVKSTGFVLPESGATYDLTVCVTVSREVGGSRYLYSPFNMGIIEKSTGNEYPMGKIGYVSHSDDYYDWFVVTWAGRISTGQEANPEFRIGMQSANPNAPSSTIIYSVNKSTVYCRLVGE